MCMIRQKIKIISFSLDPPRGYSDGGGMFSLPKLKLSREFKPSLGVTPIRHWIYNYEPSRMYKSLHVFFALECFVYQLKTFFDLICTQIHKSVHTTSRLSKITKIKSARGNLYNIQSDCWDQPPHRIDQLVIKFLHFEYLRCRDHNINTLFKASLVKVLILN